MNLYDAQRANRRKTFWIIFLFILFFGFIGMGFDYFYGGYTAGIDPTHPQPGAYEETLPVMTVLALLVAAGFALVSYFFGDKTVLASTGARQVKEAADAKERQLLNVVEEMTIAAGTPMPRVYVVPDADPNAFATGRDPRHASLAVTQGLLDSLNRDELQGVVAHELSHIRNYDIRCMTLIAALAGAIVLLADWASRTMFYRSGRSRSSSSRDSGGAALIVLVLWLVTVILAPIVSRMLAMAVSRQREYLADATGAELTRNPLGLASALAKLENASTPTRAIKQGSAHLCIVDPLGLSIGLKEGFLADLFATHPPIAKRIERLQAMAYAKKSL